MNLIKLFFHKNLLACLLRSTCILYLIMDYPKNSIKISFCSQRSNEETSKNNAYFQKTGDAHKNA